MKQLSIEDLFSIYKVFNTKNQKHQAIKIYIKKKLTELKSQ